MKSALWLWDHGYWPVPLNPRGTVLAGHTVKDPRLSQGKEPLNSLGTDWGKIKLTRTQLIRIYTEIPAAGVGIRLGYEGRLIDADCDGDGAKETLRDLLGSDVPDTLGWLANRGEHSIFLWNDRLYVFTYESGVIKIGTLELRLGGRDRQLQTVFPPTPRADGTPRPRIGGTKIRELPPCFYANLRKVLTTTRVAPGPRPSGNGHHEARGPAEKPSDYQVTKYIAEVEPAIEGERGSVKLFKLAHKLIARFGEDRDGVIDWLTRFYNDRCVPPWTLKEIEHKVDDALKTAAYDPRPGPSANGKADREDRRWEGYQAVTFADVSRKIGKMSFLWEDWLVIGNINMICSKPKHGKTRFYIALAKCLWGGTAWPDGQPNTNPAGSKMLVAPYDRNHVEIADEMEKMGIPEEAIYCAHDPEDELIVPDLATNDMMKALDWYATRDPAIKMVVIDTLTYASSTPLFKPEDMKKLLDPLMQIAAKHRLSVLVLIHENREGLALGNRITERARVLMQLERYSEADPTKLRLYVKDSNFPGRPAITVIHDHSGLKFGLDEGPIKYQNGKPRGPQPVKSERFADWLKNQLEVEPRQVVDLVRLARMDGLMESPTDERVKVSISPLYNARDQVARLYPGFVVEESEVEHGAGGRRKAWTLYGPNRQMSEPPGKAPY
jgi:hypothetical protein